LSSGGPAHPQRTCLGCRQAHDQSRLVRYVRAPDGTVVVDYRGRLPGRGAYTCLNVECLRQAVARRQFERAFRSNCQTASVDTLRHGLREALHRRLVALIGMARKSSQLIAGGNLVLDALDHPGQLQAIILAADVSAGVAEKIERKAGSQGLPCLRFATKGDLGQLLGRGERSVIALKKGPLAGTFLDEWHKYKEMSGES